MESLHDQAPALCRACVESNLDTRMVFAVPVSTSSAEFKEKVRQYHMQNFPEHGDVNVTKLMVLLYGYWYVFTEGPVGVLARGDARFRAELEKKAVMLEKPCAADVFRQPTVLHHQYESNCVKCGTCQGMVGSTGARSLLPSLLAGRDHERHAIAPAAVTTPASENFEKDVQNDKHDAGTTENQQNQAPVSCPEPNAVETGKEAGANLDSRGVEEPSVTDVHKPESVKPPEAPAEQVTPAAVEPSVGEAVPQASTRKRKAESAEVSVKKLKLDILEEIISINAGTGSFQRQDNDKDDQLVKALSGEKAGTDTGTVQKDEVAKPTHAEGPMASQDGLQRSANSSRPVDLLMSQNVDDVCDKLITQHFSDSSISKSPIKKSSSRKGNDTVKSSYADVTRQRQTISSDRSHAKQDPAPESSLKKPSDARGKPSSAKRAISSSSESSDEVEPKKLEASSKKASDVTKQASDILKPKQPAGASSAGGNSAQKANSQAKPKSPDERKQVDTLPDSESETESSDDSEDVDAKNSVGDGVIIEEQLPKETQEKQKSNAGTFSNDTTEEESDSETEAEATPKDQKSKPSTGDLTKQEKKPSTGDLSKQMVPAVQSQAGREAKPAAVSDDEETSSSEFTSDSESPAPSTKKNSRGNGSVQNRYQHIFDKTDGLEQLINLKLKRLEDTVVYETQDTEQGLPVAEVPPKQAAGTGENKKNAENVKQESLDKTKQSSGGGEKKQAEPKVEKLEKPGAKETKKTAEDSKNKITQGSVSKVKQSFSDAEKKQAPTSSKQAEKTKGNQQATSRKSTAAQNAGEQTGSTPVVDLGSSTGSKRKLTTTEDASKGKSQKKQQASTPGKPPATPKFSCSTCGKVYISRTSAYYVHVKKCGTR